MNQPVEAFPTTHPLMTIAVRSCKREGCTGLIYPKPRARAAGRPRLFCSPECAKRQHRPYGKRGPRFVTLNDRQRAAVATAVADGWRIGRIAKRLGVGPAIIDRCIDEMGLREVFNTVPRQNDYPLGVAVTHGNVIRECVKQGMTLEGIAQHIASVGGPKVGRERIRQILEMGACAEARWVARERNRESAHQARIEKDATAWLGTPEGRRFFEAAERFAARGLTVRVEPQLRLRRQPCSFCLFADDVRVRFRCTHRLWLSTPNGPSYYHVGGVRYYNDYYVAKIPDGRCVVYGPQGQPYTIFIRTNPEIPNKRVGPPRKHFPLMEWVENDRC